MKYEGMTQILRRSHGIGKLCYGEWYRQKLPEVTRSYPKLPEVTRSYWQMTGTPPGSAFSIGSFEREGMLFPKFHTLTYHEGLTAAGSDGMMLSRSAWAGMQVGVLVFR